jgi:HSP20 family protein
MLPEIWRRGASMGPSFDDFIERFLYGWPALEQSSMASWTPRADITENDKDITIDLEVPGMKKEDIKVEVRNNVLTVSGERKQERKTHTPEGSRIERHYGRFERSFTLPDTVDDNKIEAAYQGGVLTLTLPKTAKAVKKEVQVQVQG